VYDRRSRVFNRFGAHRAPLQQPLAINSHLLSDLRGERFYHGRRGVGVSANLADPKNQGLRQP
ncbi:MAG: hypothetical protein ACRD3T_20945, partial [Terriglobia bacterium]